MRSPPRRRKMKNESMFIPGTMTSTAQLESTAGRRNSSFAAAPTSTELHALCWKDDWEGERVWTFDFAGRGMGCCWWGVGRRELSDVGFSDGCTAGDAEIRLAMASNPF